jgi:hypothetical protein
VGKLVQRYVVEADPEKLCLSIFWLEVVVIESNCPDIFHRANPVLRAEDLVVLLERELDTNELLEESDACRDHPK